MSSDVSLYQKDVLINDKWQQIFRPVPRLPTMNWPQTLDSLQTLTKDVEKMDPRTVSQNFIASNSLALQHEQLAFNGNHIGI